MLRSLRHTPDTHRPLAAPAAEGQHEEVRVLREIISALCERVELLEAHALLVRPRILTGLPG